MSAKRSHNYIIKEINMSNLLNNRLNDAFGQLINAELSPFHNDFDFQLFRGQDETQLDIIEHKDSLEIVLEAPGFKNSEISAEIEGSTLVVSAESEQKEIPEDSRYLKKQIKNKSFKRLFELPDYCTKSKIEAKFENGMLCISVPKKKPEKPKKVKIM